jgi:hypothetical protein
MNRNIDEVIEFWKSRLSSNKKIDRETLLRLDKFRILHKVDAYHKQ